jgi:hypothetical protein
VTSCLSLLVGHGRTSALRHLPLTAIKGLFILGVMGVMWGVLPLLRMAFSGEGTQYLAVVFVVQVRTSAVVLLGAIDAPFGDAAPSHVPCILSGYRHTLFRGALTCSTGHLPLMG